MTAADLKPHQWTAPERNVLRALILCCAEGNYSRMGEHLDALSSEAVRDLRYGLDVLQPIVRLKDMGDRSDVRDQGSLMAVDGDKRPAPCGRCGHDERDEYPVTDYWFATRTTTTVTYCPSCPDGRCQPVLVRAGGPAVRTTVDAEEEVD